MTTIKTKTNEYEGHYTTMIDWPQPDSIKGCPMGRGNSQETAEQDLIKRILIESHIKVSLSK